MNKIFNSDLTFTEIIIWLIINAVTMTMNVFLILSLIALIITHEDHPAGFIFLGLAMFCIFIPVMTALQFVTIGQFFEKTKHWDIFGIESESEPPSEPQVTVTQNDDHIHIDIDIFNPHSLNFITPDNPGPSQTPAKKEPKNE